MTSSITRSSRSSVKKVSTNTMDAPIQKSKSSSTANSKKTKKQLQKHKKDVDLENRSQEQQQQEQQTQQTEKNNESLQGDASEHPEYIRLMNQLDQSRTERLQKVENWRTFERQSIHDWFAAQKKQAWDDFYFARKKVRSDLVQEVQQKIIRLKQELAQLNKQTKTQQLSEEQLLECEYNDDWIPPSRLAAIGSFVGGATNDEIDRDLVYARQPYNGTPTLVYSDYESRSTTDTAEDAEVVGSSPTKTEVASSSSVASYNHHEQQPAYHYSSQQNQTPVAQQYQGQQQQSNNIYPPPFEFEQVPQDGRRDWWSYRSTTTA